MINLQRRWSPFAEHEARSKYRDRSSFCFPGSRMEEYECSSIDYFPNEEYSPDPSDSTMAIPCEYIAARNADTDGGRERTPRSSTGDACLWRGLIRCPLSSTELECDTLRKIFGGKMLSTGRMVPSMINWIRQFVYPDFPSLPFNPLPFFASTDAEKPRYEISENFVSTKIWSPLFPRFLIKILKI